MEKAISRKALLKKIEELEFKIQAYDATYSDADENPQTKEDLENQLCNLYSELEIVEQI
jgi:hypothetical protein